MMNRAEMLDATESVLKEAGYHVSERCVSRRSCFNFAARRREQLTFVSVLSDVGTVTAEDSSELRSISKCFSATPLLIGNRTRRKPLENDTVYMRYNIYTITLKTLEDMVFRELHPLVEAGPGGYYVNIDGNIIREKRLKLGLSVGKLAEMIGISRRTLYGYEKGMAKASVSVTYNLEWVLGVPVVQPVNMFQASSIRLGFFATARRVIIKNRFLQTVLKRFANFNVNVTPTRRAPFDFIARCSKERLSIVAGVADEKEHNIDQRTAEIISVSKVLNTHAIFITDGELIPNNSIPLLHDEELARLKSQEDLVAYL